MSRPYEHLRRTYATGIKEPYWRTEARELTKARPRQPTTRRPAAAVQRAWVSAHPKPSACEICRREGVRLVLDHCHQSGVFRGWVCQRCNVMLGLLKDDSAVVQNALAYLTQVRV